MCLHGNAILAAACGCRCARKKDKEGEPVKEWVEAANAIYTAGLQQFPESAALHIACSNFLSTYKKSLTVSGQQKLGSPPLPAFQSAASCAAFDVQPVLSTSLLAQQQPSSCISLQHMLLPAL